MATVATAAVVAVELPVGLPVEVVAVVVTVMAPLALPEQSLGKPWSLMTRTSHRSRLKKALSLSPRVGLKHHSLSSSIFQCVSLLVPLNRISTR